MSKTLHVDPDYGSDSESGLSPKHPKKTLNGALATNPTPGTIIALRMSSLHTGSAATKDAAYTMKTNGVTLTSYATGSEPNTPPILVYPRAAQLPDGSKSVILGILGSDNIIDGIDTWSADIHQQVYQTHTGNTFKNCRAFDFGFGIVNKASRTTINDCYFYRGHMVRDGGDDAAGASAIVLERYKDNPHTGTRINRIFAELCMAPSIRFKPFDGSLGEISGGVEDVVFENCIGLDIKIFVEMGGQTALHQTISNVLFKHNLALNSQKGMAYFNNPAEAFYADLSNVRFESNTILMDDPVSAFFFAGDHGDLSKKITVKDNIIVGASSIYGTSKPGGTNLAALIQADNTVTNPNFYNAAAHDYRLSSTTTHEAGALVRVLSAAELARMGKPGGSTSTSANQIIGGTHSVPSWADMQAIDAKYRVAGMRCKLPRYRLEYELQADQKTWLKVGSYTPPEPK